MNFAMNLRVTTTLTTLIVSCTTAPSALAQVHAGDIVVRLNSEGTQLVTGIADEETGAVTMGVRVFNSTLGETLVNFTNEPGFDSGSGQFPFPCQIGFTIRRALRRWDGTSFTVIPPERIQAQLGPNGPTLTPLTDTPVVGFSLPVSTDGEYHHHIGYSLLDPAGDGIYLYEATLWTNLSGVMPSRSFWILFNQNRGGAEVEQANDWVARNLLGCASDFHADGFVTGDDYDAFVDAFQAGC